MTQKQMADRLAERGIRPTTQRLAVYDYLYRHRTHPSADTVYEALVKKHPTFSKTTVITRCTPWWRRDWFWSWPWIPVSGITMLTPHFTVISTAVIATVSPISR